MSTVLDPVVSEVTETDDPVVAHVARRDDIARAMIERAPVEALCGYVWVPSRDPSDLPRCQRCQQVLAQIKGARGGMN